MLTHSQDDYYQSRSVIFVFGVILSAKTIVLTHDGSIRETAFIKHAENFHTFSVPQVTDFHKLSFDSDISVGSYKVLYNRKCYWRYQFNSSSCCLTNATLNATKCHFSMFVQYWYHWH